MPTQQILNELGRVQTTDATQTTVLTVPFPPDSLCAFDLTIIACTDALVAASFDMKGSAKRIGSGNVGFVGGAQPQPLQTPQKDAGASTWSVNFGASGGNALIRVTGQAATSIRWTAILKGLMTQPLDNPPQDPGAIAGKAGAGGAEA